VGANSIAQPGHCKMDGSPLLLDSVELHATVQVELGNIERLPLRLYESNAVYIEVGVIALGGIHI
jgi:hypothetical protein